MNPPSPASPPPKNWIEYWSGDDFWKHSPLWRINAGLFFRRAGRLIGFRPDDSVLNIGCGPGHLERLLSPVVQDVLAVDVAPQFVELCRQNCRACDNVRVTTLGSDYTDLTVFQRKFSLFLAVSVVQYYPDLRRVESLIASARAVARPGARMLIADLPRRRRAPGFVWDGICSVALACHEGHLPWLLRAAGARWLRRSGYKNFRQQNPELSFAMNDLESLIQRMELQAQVIRQNLSIYANRLSLLIRF